MTYLEVVWQLLSAGVTRVHRDEDGTRLVQHQLGSFEVEPRHSLVDGDLNALDLLPNYRQHFQLYPVEFVETRPGARLRKTLEELTHRLVVQPVRTVEHHALRRNTHQLQKLTNNNNS